MEIKKGSKGPQVKEVQEWLNLSGIKVSIDGDFGPATHAAVLKFQASRELPATGIVTKEVMAALTASLTSATALITKSSTDTLQSMLVKVAKQHLDVHPMEVGGQNRGPWVRLYCQGQDGDPYAWCCGFVCFCLAQASKSFGVPMPYKYTLSCDNLVNQAKQLGKFNSHIVEPGHIFMVRKTSNDWIHTGIVTAVGKDYIETIEGNTNDEGSREGYEVAKRIRGLTKLDFLGVE